MHNHGCINCFNSLGVPSRMQIYKFLRKEGKGTVSSIVKEVGLKQPTISYHLKGMKEAGLLRSEKTGKEVFYSVNEACPVYVRQCALAGVKFPEN